MKRYREASVRCYGSAESGPFAELEDGRRVYGLTGAAPDLLAALENLKKFSDLVLAQLEESTSQDGQHRRANLVSRHVVRQEDFRRLASFSQVAETAIRRASC